MIIMCSACILGLRTRYNNIIDNNISYSNKHIVIPFCPEQFSTLTTPRLKATLIYNACSVVKYSKGIIDENNKDITEKFLIGANITLNFAKKIKPDIIVLRENSPSCGLSYTSMNWQKTKGMGICSYILYKKTKFKLISFQS